MSAARLAAEAAFAAPRLDPSPPLQASVTVRRARPSRGAVETVTAPPSGVAEGPLDSRSPRVFRVEASMLRSPTEPEGMDPPQLALLAPPADRISPVATPVKRRRRIGVDKRPGPVLHLVHAVPAAQAARSDAADAPVFDQLLAQLARVGELLQEIEQAQSFQFVSERFAPDWLQLSQTADAIREAIKDQML